jgi:rhodanese-related sulfurtransferase
MMQQLLEFGAHHFTLILAFIVVLVLFLTFELHSKLTGTPSVSPQSATLLMNHNDALVIDIRDKNNFTNGNILGSMNIPLAQLENNLNKLQNYKDKPVILVYVIGQTLHKTTHFLKKNGFTDLYLLKGGIAAWQQAGLPLVKK